jgi:hypothetical protein
LSRFLFFAFAVLSAGTHTNTETQGMKTLLGKKANVKAARIFYTAQHIVLIFRTITAAK